MKKRMLGCALVVAGAMTLLAQVAPPPTPRPRVSPHDTISAIVDGNYQKGSRVVVVYGRPYSKDPKSKEVRKIWGGLVPYDKWWRLGADEATLFITPVPLTVGDATIPAGAYTLFMLPSENGTTKLIVNKQIGQWGLQYDETQDLVRVDLKKDDLTTPVDQFTIAIVPKQGGGGGTLKMLWEDKQFSVDFTVKK